MTAFIHSCLRRWYIAIIVSHSHLFMEGGSEGVREGESEEGSE